MIGPVPKASGLFVAAGHEGSGLTLAPMSACILASQILHGKSETAPVTDSIAKYLRPMAAAVRG